jgi:hypothetical protein
VEALNQLIGIFNQQNTLVRQLLNDDNTIVDKNITKDSTSGTPSSLSGNEKKRSQEFCNIFVKTYFDELKKREVDTALETKISDNTKNESKGVATSTPPDSKKEATEKKESLWDKIKDKLLLAAVFVKTFWGKLKGFFSKIGNAISKVAGSIKKLAGKLLVKLKSGLSYLKTKFVSIFKAIGGKLSALWKSIKNSKAYKAFTKIVGKVTKSVKSFFTGIATKIKNVFSSIVEGIKKLVPKSLQKFLPASLRPAAGAAAKGAAGAAAGAAASAAAKGAAGAAAKTSTGGIISNTLNKGISAVKGAASKGATAVKGAAGAALSFTPKKVKAIINSAAKGLVKQSGGIMKVLSKFAKIPVIGPLIEGFLIKNDLEKLQQEHSEGKITSQELNKSAGQRVISGVVAMGGAALGGVIGTALLPGAGTLLGAIGGSLLGDLAGRYVGEALSEYVIAPQYVDKIGAFALNSLNKRAEPGEMQDFIIKGGKVHKFNNRDEVMGLKTGGAINEFLRGKAKRLLGKGGGGSEMSHLLRINSQSNNYLRIIATNTGIMAKSGGGDQAPPILIPQGSSSPPPSKSKGQKIMVDDNRSSYFDSVYSLG